MKKRKVEYVCGEGKGIYYNGVWNHLNVDLAIDKLTKAPLLIFEICKGKKGKEVFRLHLKEAIELKSIIDNLTFDHLELRLEEHKQEHYEKEVEEKIKNG